MPVGHTEWVNKIREWHSTSQKRVTHYILTAEINFLKIEHWFFNNFFYLFQLPIAIHILL